MKRTHMQCHTPPSITVRVRANMAHALQVRRSLQLKSQGPSAKSAQTQQQDVMHLTKMTMTPSYVIQWQEMASYFRLFYDDHIQDFLWADGCCKVADKYLLAMTFVYFKRASLSIAEYTKNNFFIALYLANTMEEDEEEKKYEIFPWALNKNWKNQFPGFLRQRDKFWIRIKYRAAVSRRCCEEVMAIMPSHFIWKRERSMHHSGAQRHYGVGDQTQIPRGPFASPVICVLCHRSAMLDQDLGSFPPALASPKAPCPRPFTDMLTLDATPPGAAASGKKSKESRGHAQPSPRCCTEKVPWDKSTLRSTLDSSMDWLSDE